MFLGGRPGTRLMLLLFVFDVGDAALFRVLSPDLADAAEGDVGLLAICILHKGIIQLFFQKKQKLHHIFIFDLLIKIYINRF